MTGPAVAVSGLLCRTVSAGRKRCALKGALLTNPYRLFGTVSIVRLSESPSLVREGDNRGCVVDKVHSTRPGTQYRPRWQREGLIHFPGGHVIYALT